MASDDANKRGKIFPGKGGQKPEIEVDDTKSHTEAVTDKSKGTVYKGGEKYKGKHKK